MDSSFKQKINTEIAALYDTVDEMDKIDIYGAPHPRIADYAFFTSVQGTFSWIDSVLAHKTSPSIFNNLGEIVKSLETCTRLNHEELENQNRLTIRKLDQSSQTSPNTEVKKQMALLANSPKHSEDQIPVLLKIHQNLKRQSFLTHFIGQHYPDTKTYKDNTKKENYRPKSLMNTGAKFIHNFLIN